MAIQWLIEGESDETHRQKINENFQAFLDVNSMNSVSYINGTEFVPLTQDGVGKKATPQQLVGDPYKQRQGHAENVAMGFSDFGRLDASLIVSSLTSGGKLPGEPFNARFGGAGAGVLHGGASAGRSALQLTTGSTVDGWVSVAHTDNPMVVFIGEIFDNRWHIALSAAPGGGQNFTARIGFVVSTGTKTDISQGVLFECTEASANWQAIVKNGAGLTPVNTGIAANTAGITLRVRHDKIAEKSRYWINGVELPPILHSTRVPDFFSSLTMVCSLEKTLGGAARTMNVLGHKYTNTRAVLPHFGQD